MKKIISFCVLLLLLTGITQGQTNTEVAQKHPIPIDGTYQIQVVNSRNKPNIPYNLNQLVLENRDATEVKYVTIGSEVRIKVLPLSEINKPDFKPLPKIAYVSQ